MSSNLEYAQRILVDRTWRGPLLLWTRWVRRVLSMTDLMFQLIAHQPLFASGDSRGAPRRRRNTRAYQECSTQLNIDSGLQVLVGSSFVPSDVMCTHDERKVNVETQRSPDLLAYGGVTERVCTLFWLTKSSH